MTPEEFTARYMPQFSEQQKAAVRETERPVLLLAVPGSGKTTVLVTRLGYMALCRGIDPARILAVTYTVAATRELRARFTARFPELAGVYSWWSYRFHARENNAGWRIDYFIVSERLLPRVLSSEIRTDVFGSDHCPVVLELNA